MFFHVGGILNGMSSPSFPLHIILDKLVKNLIFFSSLKIFFHMSHPYLLTDFKLVFLWLSVNNDFLYTSSINPLLMWCITHAYGFILYTEMLKVNCPGLIQPSNVMLPLTKMVSSRWLAVLNFLTHFLCMQVTFPTLSPDHRSAKRNITFFLELFNNFY